MESISELIPALNKAYYYLPLDNLTVNQSLNPRLEWGSSADLDHHNDNGSIVLGITLKLVLMPETPSTRNILNSYKIKPNVTKLSNLWSWT